jgi:hypothetical protein
MPERTADGPDPDSHVPIRAPTSAPSDHDLHLIDTLFVERVLHWV